MKLLLDTHAVLWLGDRRPLVPADVRAAIHAPGATVLLSAVVVWEVAIKTAVGKLAAPADFPEVLATFGFTPLPVTAEHAWAVRELPGHHGDPFDRLLVAQALSEGATLVTADARLREYEVPVLWG